MPREPPLDRRYAPMLPSPRSKHPSPHDHAPHPRARLLQAPDFQRLEAELARVSAFHVPGIDRRDLGENLRQCMTAFTNETLL